jgi:hypothetical protein
VTVTQDKYATEYAALSQGALAALGAGDTVLAKQKYRLLLDRNPGDPAILQNLLSILVNEGSFEEALTIYRNLEQIQGNSVDLLLAATAMLMHAPDALHPLTPEAAVGEYESLLERDGADEMARVNLTTLVAKFYARFAARYRPVMISTVGGAGTYFTIHFFEFLERRARAYSRDYDPLPQGSFRTLMAFPNLKLFKLTLHGVCPGFEDSYQGHLRRAWDRLATEGEVERVPEGLRDCFDPRLNPQTRLVYVYRHPFDWAITVFRQAVRAGRAADTPDALSRTVRGLLTKRFVAQYFSFRTMAAQYPDQITLVSFEELTRDATRVFGRMLDRFGIGSLSPDLIRSSVRSSSPKALAKLEDRGGRSSGPSDAVTHFDRDPQGRSRVVLDASDRAAITELFGRLEIPASELGISESDDLTSRP